MFRRRRIVAAVWVMLVLGGSTAPTFAAARPESAARQAAGAAGIDATGATDVTAELQALFDRTPDGGVVELEPGADYRVEGTLVLEDARDVVVEGNGARIFATTRADWDRKHLRLIGGSDVVVRNLEIEGANPHAGLDDRAYVPEIAGQSGIKLEGVTDVELDGVDIHHTYGDLVTISRREGDHRWSERVWVHDSTLTHSGRQGIAVVAARDVVIERNSFTDMRRATVDLEPPAESWGADNIHILDNEVGPGRLLFVAAAGAGPVNRVVVARNTLSDRNLNIWVLAEEGARRRQVWVVDNTTDTSARNLPLRVRRVDGVVVHGNRQPLRDTALVEATDSCDVAITDNDIAPGSRTLEGGTRECNFVLPVEPPAPPPVAGRGQEQAPPPTTTPPTTAAPSTTTPPTTPTTERAPSTPTSTPSTSEASGTDASLAAASRSSDRGVAIPVVVLAVVLAALTGAGGAWAVSARRRPR